VFIFDQWALWCVLGLVLFLILMRRRRRKGGAFLYHCDISAVKALPKGWRVRMTPLPRLLKGTALACFLVAFVDPRLVIDQEAKDRKPVQEDFTIEEKNEEVEIPTEGIALYFLLDQSGSMEEIMPFIAADGKRRRLTRMEVLRQVTSQFIKGNERLGLAGHSNDMIGLAAFARVAHILTPLTLDHRTVLDKLAKLQVVTAPEENGTAIGYALFKTINLIVATKYFAADLIAEGRPAYEIKNRVIVLVTDGIQEPNPLDKEHHLRPMAVERAVEFAVENSIRIYVVNVNPDIRHGTFVRARKELQHAAEATGGKFFIADNSKMLREIYQEIDALEKSTLPEGRVYEAAVEERRLAAEGGNQKRIAFYPFLIASGMIALATAFFLQSTLLRRVP